MADKITVYQKPTCTKCRVTLNLLREKGVEFEAVNYYEEHLTADKLRELLEKLGIPAIDLVRKDEPAARKLGIGKRHMSDDELIRLMVENPDLIQRPIVVRGRKAVLGRPPESIEKLL